ncbi:hypothetical protein B0H14DRAFT_3169496 [Mycena olivaceomarginata]|nr:hypothetical protein B0H14DRAFT_3169496 [Mycena olivaceomarginata]
MHSPPFSSRSQCAMWRSVFISMWLDFLILGSLVATGSAEHVPFLQQGFLFDYNIATQPVPIPITEQCETIHIEWSRHQIRLHHILWSSIRRLGGALCAWDPVSSSSIKFAWWVPYLSIERELRVKSIQWDSNGVPGGCQAMYIVIQNSTVANPTCQNITFPALLDVEATVPDGPMSQYGWIDQCTDLSVTPKSGKPPFTLTVAPALHPPYNVTSNSMETIDWTVSLSWSIPFFLSLASADGQLWSYGPLHAGGMGPSDCLAPGTMSASPSSKVHRITVGAGLGGAFATGIIGALGAFLRLYFRDRNRKRPEHPKIEAFDYKPNPEPTTVRIKSFNSVGTRQTSGHSQTDCDPVRDNSRGTLYLSDHVAKCSLSANPLTCPIVLTTGTPLITNAEEVVELPPRYRRNGNSVPLPSIREKAESLPSRPMRVASTGLVPLFRRP